MTIAGLMAVLTLGVGVPLNLYVTIRLWRLTHQSPDLRVLRERAVVATAVLLLIVVFGLIFVNNELWPPPIDFNTSKYFTRGATLILSIVPAVYWLRLYRRR